MRPLLKERSSPNLFLMPQSDPTTGKRVSGRRSQRLLLRVPVEAQRKQGSDSTPENTETLAVNAHGALILLVPPVEEGDRVSLKNKMTGEEQLCSVVYLGLIEAGRLQVGIEFTQPSPQFWQVVFPPEDWNTSTKNIRPEAKI
jgi:hypothetical protein